MLISELMKILQGYLAEHGDLPTLTDAAVNGYGEAKMSIPWPVVVRVDGDRMIAGFSPNYSEDLPKAVWL